MGVGNMCAIAVLVLLEASLVWGSLGLVLPLTHRRLFSSRRNASTLGGRVRNISDIFLLIADELDEDSVALTFVNRGEVAEDEKGIAEPWW